MVAGFRCNRTRLDPLSLVDRWLGGHRSESGHRENDEIKKIFTRHRVAVTHQEGSIAGLRLYNKLAAFNHMASLALLSEHKMTRSES